MEHLGNWLFPWQSTWLLVGAIFTSFKLFTILRLSSPERHRMSPSRLAEYLFLWPGMLPRPFLYLSGPEAAPCGNTGPLVREGLIKAIGGSALLWIVPRLLPAATPLVVRAWLGMIGIALLLHFGVFQLLAAAWRRAGVPVDPLFAQPTRSASLTEFWSVRWNRAFSDFAREQILKPLARPLGPRLAGFAVFAFSGLVHDLVISVPAGGGYGLPTLYFLIQGCLVGVEGSRWCRALLRRRPALGRLGTWVAVLGPAPLLFPPPFLERVVLPFLSAMGAS